MTNYTDTINLEISEDELKKFEDIIMHNSNALTTIAERNRQADTLMEALNKILEIEDVQITSALPDLEESKRNLSYGHGRTFKVMEDLRSNRLKNRCMRAINELTKG